MTMTRNDHDERFEVTEISRRGAHRARPNPLTGLLPILALVVVVIGVLGLAYLFFGRGAASTSTATATGPASPGPTAASAPAASAVSTPAPSASQNGAQPTSSAPVDKTVTLNFYNGTSPNVPGLSRKASAELAGAGWTIGTVETWTGAPLGRTTVYYSSPEQLNTARAVVKVLGVGTVKLNTIRAAQGLAVVVSNDYLP